MSQGTEKCEYWARNQCPAWIGLLGMPGKTVGGDDERWHRAWMDAQCNNAMWGQTVSRPVGRHLNPALTEHTCTLTHICHRKSLSNRCWSSQNLFPPCMSHEFFNVPPFLKEKKKHLFHPLLQLAVMEAIRDSDGRGWAVSGVCACRLLSFCVQVGHRKGCISAAELFMLFRYCTLHLMFDKLLKFVMCQRFSGMILFLGSWKLLHCQYMF